MDYTILAAELAKPEYDGLSDQDAADVLNAQTVTTRQPVGIGLLMAAAYTTGLYPRLIAAQWDPDTPVELRAVVVSLLDIKAARFETVDMDDPVVESMFGALQAAGLLDDDERAVFDGLGNAAMSRAAQLGLGYVAAGDVQQARHGGY